MRTLFSNLIPFTVCLSLLAGCGGEVKKIGSTDSSTSSTSNSTSTSTATSSLASTNPAKIGSGSGNNFVNGVIAVGVGSNQLSAGGATTLTINVVDSQNALATSSVQVTFNSLCFAAGESKFKVGTSETNKITTDTGEATITYQANGCQGNDPITANVVISGQSVSATASLTIAQDVVSTITPVSITPTQIGIKGTGGQETAAVKFQVLGSTGAPIKNVDVDFTLSSTVGGLSLASSEGRTDVKGEVIAIVQSGAKSANVAVTATARVAQVSTQATGLIVSTGVPDQNSMSLSVAKFNPAAWETDGIEVEFTVRLADAANNKVPDGTPVYFTTNGGAIPPRCTTSGGGCTVKWVSQRPRPADGVVTVLATAQGDESFIDVDGSGYFEQGVDIFDNSNCLPNVPDCDDLGEAYLDSNHNNVRDTDEIFEDYNGNKSFDTANGIYNGVLCKTTTDGSGCTKTGVTIRDDAVIVMSSKYPLLSGNRLISQPGNVAVGLGQTVTLDLALADKLGNSMPAGTTISITSETNNFTISHNFPSSGVISTETGPTPFTITLKGDATAPASGSFIINITTGDVTTSTAATTVN
jgi:hypothetical protein